MAAPAGNAWNLVRNGNEAVATFVGPLPPGINWAAQFRAVAEAAWLEAGGDTLDTPLAQGFEPWPQGGVEARVGYTDGHGQLLSEWSATKQLA